MPSENAISILVLFIGAFAATGASLILSLGCTVSYLRRKRLGWFATLVCATAVLTATLAAWTTIRLTILHEEDQLSDIGLGKSMASYERTRAIHELAGEALPKPLRDRIAIQLDVQKAALDALEASIRAFHRAGPWNENHSLHHLRSNVAELMNLQRKLETALRCVDCAAVVTAGDVDWPDLLEQTWQIHLQNLGVVGEGFAGIDFLDEDIGYVSTIYAVIRSLAGLILTMGVALLIAGGFVAFRRRSLLRSDVVIMLGGAGILAVALTLFGFSSLASGALLERSFQQLRETYHAALALREPLRSAERKEFSPRVRVLFHEFERDHRGYFSEVHRLGGLVGVWDEAVLRGKPATDAVPLNAKLTRDELADQVRAQVVKSFRSYAFLGTGLELFRCQGAAAPDSDPLRQYRQVWQPTGGYHPLKQMMKSR